MVNPGTASKVNNFHISKISETTLQFFFQEVKVNVSHLTIPPSSAARANLHHFSSSPPLLVSPPTHTKKFPVSPPSFLIFHLDLFLLFGVLPCFTPTILLTLPPSSPFDCYHCAPQLPLSSYLPIFQLGFHHCCQYNPPTAPISLISRGLGFGKSRHES